MIEADICKNYSFRTLSVYPYPRELSSPPELSKGAQAPLAPWFRRLCKHVHQDTNVVLALLLPFEAAAELSAATPSTCNSSIP